MYIICTIIIIRYITACVIKHANIRNYSYGSPEIFSSLRQRMITCHYVVLPFNVDDAPEKKEPTSVVITPRGGCPVRIYFNSIPTLYLVGMMV